MSIACLSSDSIMMHTYYEHCMLFAADGMDYMLMDTTLIFPSHSKPGYVKNVTVVILSDSIVERTEYIQVHLSSNDPHATIDSNKKDARVSIYDQSGELNGTFHSKYQYIFSEFSP